MPREKYVYEGQVIFSRKEKVNTWDEAMHEEAQVKQQRDDQFMDEEKR